MYRPKACLVIQNIIDMTLVEGHGVSKSYSQHAEYNFGTSRFPYNKKLDDDAISHKSTSYYKNVIPSIFQSFDSLYVWAYSSAWFQMSNALSARKWQ